MRLILVRHGETHMNKNRLILGLMELPLNSTGTLQARSVAALLGSEMPFHLYSSPVIRALETAQAISRLNDVPIIEMKDLREMDAGVLEGLSGQKARQLYPDIMAKWDVDPSSVTMPEGESLSNVQERAWKVIEYLQRVHTTEKVVAVTHNFVILTILCKVLSISLASFRRFKLDLGSMTTLDFSKGDATIISVNHNCNSSEQVTKVN